MAPKQPSLATMFPKRVRSELVKKDVVIPLPKYGEPQTSPSRRSTPMGTPPNGLQTQTTSSSNTSSSQSYPSDSQTQSSHSQIEDDEEELKLPEGPYQEFRLMSSALNGWKYDVMKFDSRKPIDISRWQGPIKLNRKDLRRNAEQGEDIVMAPPEAVGPMMGPDGKPVIGMDGKVVMVDAEGKPIHNNQNNGAGGNSGAAKGKGAANGANSNAKKRFQKKTRQVHYVPEEVRQLRKEERYPWVVEDSTGDEVWVGQLEEVSKAETHAFFMPAANTIFKFVPAHRWYKFQKKLKHTLPTDTLQVEQLYTKAQKRDPAAWLAARKGGKPSEATKAMFEADAKGQTVAGPSSLVHTAGHSLGPGGRRLRTVDAGSDLFGDEEDGEGRRRKTRERGAEGDLDELLFEEEFADDDEKMEPEGDDEEAKETEDRMKREYKAANKQRDGHIDESDDEDTPGVTKQQKAMQKLIRSREGNEAYDSDEEQNPYASSAEEEEDEELPVVVGEPAIIPQPQQVDVRAKAAAQSQELKSKEELANGSTSSAASPSMGGHSVVAKRATSPNIPKPNLSKGNSPTGSRATSPNMGSRATSPAAGGGSKIGGFSGTNKRKAWDEASGAGASPNNGNANGEAPKPKKRKPDLPVGELTDAMVIDWLRETPSATTRDCIQHFGKWLKGSETKGRFTALVKNVAAVRGGILVLKPAYRNSGSPGVPSPPTTPVA